MSGHPEKDVNRAAVSSFVDRTARALPDGALVLDAGAGEGRYRPLFGRHRYVTADLAVGDPAWDYGGLSVRADLAALPFRGGVFDAVISTQTLEHLREPGRFLGEAARVLRDGGRMALTAPQCFRLHQAPHDYFRFTRHGLEYLLDRAGFCEIRVTPQGGYFWFLADAVRPLHRRLFGRERHLAWRVLAAPLALVSKAVLTTLLPFVLYRLDFLDEKRAHTTGHEATARKPGTGEGE
jgi:SAM-dependent methyltransferase